MAEQPPQQCTTYVNGAPVLTTCPSTSTPIATQPPVSSSTSITINPNVPITTPVTQPLDTTSTHSTTAVTGAGTPSLGSSSTGFVPASSTSNISPAEQHGGFSTGAAAGIAIGCAVAGLVIGLIAAILLSRLRKRKDPAEAGHTAVFVEPKAPPSINNSSSDTNILLSQFLLDGEPDQDIAKELQSLGELIRQHVENNYHLQPVDASTWILSQSLLSLGLGEHGSGPDTEAITALCVGRTTRYLGLQHVISHVVFASIDFHSRSRLSMLPGPVAAFLQSVPAAEHRGSNALAVSQALSTWRRLSAFLLHPNRSQRTALPTADAMIAPQAQALTNALNTFLQPFVAGDKGSQQADHLQEVIAECARFGYVLLSHPIDWKLVFEGTSAAAADSGMVVVCPGLEKCADRDGTPYRPPWRVVAPVEMRL